MTQNKNPFHKMLATFAAKALFGWAILLLFAQKTAFLDKIFIIFWQSMGTQNVNFTHFI
jgi:hypothetical protein